MHAEPIPDIAGNSPKAGNNFTGDDPIYGKIGLGRSGKNESREEIHAADFSNLFDELTPGSHTGLLDTDIVAGDTPLNRDKRKGETQDPEAVGTFFGM